MKRHIWIIIVIIVSTVFILLAITNPDTDDLATSLAGNYVKHASAMYDLDSTAKDKEFSIYSRNIKNLYERVNCVFFSVFVYDKAKDVKLGILGQIINIEALDRLTY